MAHDEVFPPPMYLFSFSYLCGLAGMIISFGPYAGLAGGVLLGFSAVTATVSVVWLYLRILKYEKERDSNV